MAEEKPTTLEQVRAFLAGTMEAKFTARGESERYKQIAGVLHRFVYKRLEACCARTLVGNCNESVGQRSSRTEESGATETVSFYPTTSPPVHLTIESD